MIYRPRVPPPAGRIHGLLQPKKSRARGNLIVLQIMWPFKAEFQKRLFWFFLFGSIRCHACHGFCAIQTWTNCSIGWFSLKHRGLLSQIKLKILHLLKLPPNKLAECFWLSTWPEFSRIYTHELMKTQIASQQLHPIESASTYTKFEWCFKEWYRQISPITQNWKIT